MLEEIKNIKSDKKDLRNFGITIGVLFLLIAGFLFFKEKETYQTFFYLTGAFIGLGLIIPIILKPVYLVWMVFAVMLGWFMTRVIITLLYYIILTPISIICRIFGKDFLQLKIKNDRSSYWIERKSDIELNQDYEKQF